MTAKQQPYVDSWMKSRWYSMPVRIVVGCLTMALTLGVYGYGVVEDGDYGLLIFLALGFGCVIPLERLIPRNRYAIVRPEFATDLMHVFVTSLLSFLPLLVVFPLLHAIRIDGIADLVQARHFAVQILMAFVLREFLIYWGHRITHIVPLLWRFHAVHHSIRTLDWLGGERRHPIDGLFISLFVGIPMILGGFDLVDLLLLGIFSELWDMTIHANLRWRLKFLDGIWVTSEFHHWHHARDKAIYDKNFSGALPIFDWLFGTWYLPDDKRPSEYGIMEPMPSTYMGQLVHPFISRTPDYSSESQSAQN